MRRILCLALLIALLLSLPAVAEWQLDDIVSFGSYEQDNDTTNGPEPIEWIVLEVRGGTALLISRYALDARPYHTKAKEISWEKCSLRSWLNEDFVAAAFSAEEQRMLEAVTVTARKNATYDTPAGHDTLDRVYIPGNNDVKALLTSPGVKVCRPTPYAIARGASTWTNGACWWWLRTPGKTAADATYVYGDGSVYTDGIGVSIDDGCVRPMIRVRY